MVIAKSRLNLFHANIIDRWQESFDESSNRTKYMIMEAFLNEDLELNVCEFNSKGLLVYDIFNINPFNPNILKGELNQYQEKAKTAKKKLSYCDLFADLIFITNDQYVQRRCYNELNCYMPLLKHRVSRCLKYLGLN